MTVPGTRAVIGDVEVVAFSCRSCDDCAFEASPVELCADNKNNCMSTDDHPSVIWLTPLNYVARRLVGETT